MSRHGPVSAGLYDEGRLRELLTTELGAEKRITINGMEFDDGYWKVTVTPSINGMNAAELAELFANVEEKMFQDFGVNTTIRLSGAPIATRR